MAVLPCHKCLATGGMDYGFQNPQLWVYRFRPQKSQRVTFSLRLGIVVLYMLTIKYENILHFLQVSITKLDALHLRMLVLRTVTNSR